MTEASVIEVQFRAVGNAAVATAFDSVSASSAKADAKVLQFDRSMAKINEGTSKGARLFGSLATSAGSLDGSFSKLGSTAMRTSETIATFAGYLGQGGPWGLAVGAAVAGVSLFSQKLAENKRAADEAANALARYEKAELDREERKKTDPHLAALRGRADSQSDAAEFDRVLQFYKDKFGTDDPTFSDQSRSGGGRSKSTEFDDAMARSRKNDEQRAAHDRLMEAGAIQDRRENEKRMGSLSIDGPDALAEKNRMKLEMEQSFQNSLVDMRENTEAQLQKLDEERAASTVFMQSVAMSAYTAVAGSGLDAFRKLGQGQKMSTKAVLESIGDQVAAAGQGHILQAGAMFFIPGMEPLAPGLLAAGTAEMLFGVGLGATLRGGGGGGRSTRGSAGRDYAGSHESGGNYLDRTRATSPTSASGGGSGNTYIIYNRNEFPSIIAPTAEHGVLVEKAMTEKLRAGL